MHPLVAEERRGWLQQHCRHPVLLLDIPLLYETGAESMVWNEAPLLHEPAQNLSEGATRVRPGMQVDAVAVVSAPAELQRQRVLGRPGMTEGCQMPTTFFLILLVKPCCRAHEDRHMDCCC